MWPNSIVLERIIINCILKFLEFRQICGQKKSEKNKSKFFRKSPALLIFSTYIEIICLVSLIAIFPIKNCCRPYVLIGTTLETKYSSGNVPNATIFCIENSHF